MRLTRKIYSIESCSISNADTECCSAVCSHLDITTTFYCDYYKKILNIKKYKKNRNGIIALITRCTQCRNDFKE